MRLRAFCALLTSVSVCTVAVAGSGKPYKHAPEYQVAVLDQTIRVNTESDATLGYTSTDAKFYQGGQGVHLLHTDSGDYRVEAPANTCANILAVIATPLLLVGFLFFVAYLVFKVLARATRLRDRICTRLRDRFQLDNLYLSKYGGGFVGFSFNRRTVVLGKLEDVVEYPFHQITAVEIVRDGSSLSQVNRGSQIISAAIGDALFGTAGAIIGGLSGSSRSGSRILELAIKVVVNDNNRPAYEVIFLRAFNTTGHSNQSSIVRTAQRELDQVYAHFLNALRTN